MVVPQLYSLFLVWLLFSFPNYSSAWSLYLLWIILSTKRLCKFGFHGLYTSALFLVVVGIEENDSHWVKGVRIWSYSGPHFSRIFPQSNWIQKDTGYPSVCSSNAQKCRKNADHNNSKYGHFLRGEFLFTFPLTLRMSQRSSERSYGKVGEISF